ncbi:MAG: tetratricopeptide repeat protein [Deltaproteobacteria bacterium]|nr:tetratricopeptide repeat protein [Deltaproteobacteria bacterium]MBW2136505.1 tetratricopeptide repeat protein [Deltaproteobacteria bacterium]
MFAIQDEVSRAIVRKLKPRLLDKSDKVLAKRYTENVEAYELYVKGRFFTNKMSYRKAIEYFEEATALDPNYALPYAGLAEAYTMMALFFPVSLKEYRQKAKSAAMKALMIDDMLSEAYTSVGNFKRICEWDWQGAETAFKRAIDLNPGDALAHVYYAAYLWAVGRLDEGIAEIKKGLELDPLSRNAHYILGHSLSSADKLDQAIKQNRNALDLYPGNPVSMTFLGKTNVEKGNYAEGIALLNKAASITRGKSPFALGTLGWAYGVAGKREEAQEILDEVLERSKKGYFSPNFIAQIYTGLGNKDKALEWLEKACEERDPTLFPLKTLIHYRSLHSDPRFTALLKKMGLED